MDGEVKEKLDLIDQQIENEKLLYNKVISQEKYYKSTDSQTLAWNYSTVEREKEIIAKIHELQSAKQRLISGEKLPELVYIDREIPKYITTKEVHVYRSSLFAVTSLFLLFLLSLFIACCRLGMITVTFNFLEGKPYAF